MDRKTSYSAIAAASILVADPVQTPDDTKLPSSQFSNYELNDARITDIELNNDAESALAICTILGTAIVIKALSLQVKEIMYYLRSGLIAAAVLSSPSNAEASEPRPSTNERLPETIVIVSLLVMIGAAAAKTIENHTNLNTKTLPPKLDEDPIEAPRPLNDVQLKRKMKELEKAKSELAEMKGTNIK